MDVGADGVGDRELVARFKETRDPAWFASLFERHRKLVYALCYAMLENRAVAEDMLQDTFVKAYREIGRFNEADPESRFAAWLCTIARNLCFSELRKNQVRQRHQHDPFDRGQPDEETTLSLIELKARIKALPQEVQQCWLLFRLDGYTNEEIACLTGYSPQQVKNYLRVAREKLEKQLK